VNRPASKQVARPIRRKFLPVAVSLGKERPVDRKQMAAVLPKEVLWFSRRSRPSRL